MAIARRVRGTMPAEANLRVTLDQKVNLYRLYRGVRLVKITGKLLKACQQLVMKVSTVRQAQPACGSPETLVGAHGVNPKNVPHGRQAR